MLAPGRFAAIAVVVAIAGTLVSAVRPATAFPDRQASEIWTYQRPLAENDQIVAACGRDPADGTTGVAFAAYSVTDADGSVTSGALSLTVGWNDSYVGYRAFGGEETVLAGEGPPGFGFGLNGRAVRAGMFRGAWARWGLEGGNSGCVFVHNGSFIEDGSLRPDARATYALSTDFSGDPVVAGQACVPMGDQGFHNCVGAGAAVLQAYKRDASGYLFAYLDPNDQQGGQLGYGASLTRADGPSGEHHEGVGHDSAVLVTQPTDGEWTYSIDAQAAASAHPVLWIIDA